MIRHVVMLKVRPEVTEAHMDGIFGDLMGLRQKIPAIVAIHIGRNESPENLDQGFRHGFTIDFADWAGLHAYLPHPDHQRVGAALVAAAQGGLDGLIVFDLPFDGPAS